MDDARDSLSLRPIRFGTGGWRGVVGEELTFPRLRALLHAVARWTLAQHAGRRVVVARDTRFLGRRMVDTAVAILAEHGLEALVARGTAPTPLVAHAVRRQSAAAGIMFTASHNAPDYQGVKVLGSWGGVVCDEQVHEIERLAGAELADARPPRDAPSFQEIDLASAYRDDLLAVIADGPLASTPLAVRYDAMHGTGAGVLDRVLEAAGVAVHVRRAEPDPNFGGVAPDPVAASLQDLAEAVAASKAPCLGLATDGDADRFGVIDGDGRMLTATEALALLVEHLAAQGRVDGKVAISMSTGSLVERVAESHGLQVVRHPIGFKHLTHALSSGNAALAGDESGGFALAPVALDKDGVLASCLMAEIAAAAGGCLRARLDVLEERHGHSVCGRAEVPGTPDARQRLSKLVATPPGRVDGCAVREVRTEDGLYFRLDDGFVMIRASGTEPVLRLYAEASSREFLDRRLISAAQQLNSPA